MRGVLMSLVVAVIFLVIIGVTLSVGAEITSEISDDLSGTAQDAALNATEAIADLAEWQTTISTVIAAVIIIGLLLAGFGVFLLAKGRF